MSDKCINSNKGKDEKKAAKNKVLKPEEEVDEQVFDEEQVDERVFIDSNFVNWYAPIFHDVY